GLRSEQQRNGRLSSEYQRQFMWKTPAADSPLLAAHEVLYCIFMSIVLIQNYFEHHTLVCIKTLNGSMGHAYSLLLSPEKCFVQELRDKADAYRKRAWGTHFSRQHLNQILSNHNWMWEPSSGTSSSSSIESEACSSSTPIIEALDLARAGSVRGSSSPGPSASVAASRRSSPGDARLHEDPTLPVQRKLAWDEEEGLGERNESEISVEKNEGNPKDTHGDMKERNERLHALETESSSVVDGSGDSINRGRLPTPKLRTMQTVQRTHHDRTTPDFKLHCIAKVESRSLPRSSPAAGLTTVDPLPMREDAWSDEEAADYSTNPRQPKPSQIQQTSHRHKAAIPPPANRIQGTMRNPEFQHNGTVPFSIHSHRSEANIFVALQKYHFI
uniref:Nuclear protein MDM1 n=1 Tax=Sinocyclocheilus grahami TaxID=75366 RepID=A0A672KCF9_SINGR